MSDSNSFSTTAVYTAIAVLLVLVMKLAKDLTCQPLGSIPTIGPSGPLVSYIGAFKFLFNASSMIQEGYDKYKCSAFKVANLNRWLVVISGPKLIEELRKAPGDEISFSEAANEMVQIPYTLGAGITNDPYHLPIVSVQLTRNINNLAPELKDEMKHAFEDAVVVEGQEWTSVPALDTMMHVICRISNRVFVGRPLCQNPEFIALNVKFATDVVKGAIIISMFPSILRPIAARIFTNLPRRIDLMTKYLQPIIESRQSKIDQFGKDYPGKPNDMLSWLMNEAKGYQRTVKDLTLRILAINFASIHTSSMAFTHALYHLAANPQYIQPLREEIEEVVRKEGWTKSGIDEMRKVDSFLKESMRFTGLGALSMMRKAIKPFTFSDGTYLPEGTFIFAASGPIHTDSCNYEYADEFDGFRFAKMQAQRDNLEDAPNGVGGMNAKFQMVTTNTDYLPWGYGKRACPGRFFATTELKMMLAHIVVTYDIKLDAEGGMRPENQWIEANCLPHRKARVMFRKRAPV